MKNIFLAALFLGLVHIVSAQDQIATFRNYKPVSSGSLVQDKNFYLFTLLQKSAPAQKLLLSDNKLKSIGDSLLRNINKQITRYQKDRSPLVNSFILTDNAIREIKDRLNVLSKGKPFTDIITQHIIPSGYFQNVAELPQEKILGEIWEQSARAINAIIETYGNGKAPMYPKIDSVTYVINSDNYKESLLLWSQEIYSDASTANQPFYTASLQYALRLLDINNRDEAARYEPLETTENEKAVAYSRKINWDKYPYTAIVILGAVSPIYDSQLPPMGKLNVKLGADNYKKSLAPLIVVSGGHVHPFRTKISEAIAMKKELIEKYQIPESCIIIEPHARHTTTNLRNTTRLFVAYKIPIDKKCLLVTNNPHSVYLESQKFIDRCQNELSYQPGAVLKRLSPSTVEFLPNVKSLQKNPLDPLDP